MEYLFVSYIIIMVCCRFFFSFSASESEPIIQFLFPRLVIIKYYYTSRQAVRGQTSESVGVLAGCTFCLVQPFCRLSREIRYYFSGARSAWK